jgi:putative spermidine/putrescine transport system permease protein
VFRVLVVLIAAFLLLPTIIIVPISFTSGETVAFPLPGLSLRWYLSVFNDPAWRAAMLTSLWIALATVVLSVIMGTAAALGLARSSFTAKPLIRGLVLSPLVTPVIVLAIGTFMVFARWGLAGTYAGLIIAHTVLALPFVIVSVTASLQTLNANLELASLGLGAGPWRTFFRVMLPLILPGVAAGAVFAFITSWDEVVTAIFLTTTSLRTVPVLVWGQVRTEISPAVAAVGTILIAISAAGLVASLFVRRRT